MSVNKDQCPFTCSHWSETLELERETGPRIKAYRMHPWLPPVDMFKPVQLGPHYTVTPSADIFKPVHCVTRTSVGKRAISFRLQCLSCFSCIQGVTDELPAIFRNSPIRRALVSKYELMRVLGQFHALIRSMMNMCSRSTIL